MLSQRQGNPTNLKFIFDHEESTQPRVVTQRNTKPEYLRGRVDNILVIMAATIESTAKALETATISKTKELKGVSTPPFGTSGMNPRAERLS